MTRTPSIHSSIVERIGSTPLVGARSGLAREEAIFAGTSTGANLVAALRVAERLGPGATVVTVMCDSGIKYLSTDLYQAG